jgi:Family of unknown function (DUF6452)
MKKLAQKKVLIIISGLILIMISCTPESCFEETEPFVKASLYLQTTGKLLAPDSLTVYGVSMEKDTLYKKATGVTIAHLPLNAGTHECSFVLKINGITDTVTFKYNTYPYLVSKECGFTFYHDLYPDSLVYTRHTIDTIYIRKNVITTLNEENIRIFY